MHGRRADLLVALVAAAVAVARSAVTRSFSFAIIDDSSLVLIRPTVTDPLNQSLVDLLVTPGMGHAMPVTNLSLAVDHALWGLVPGPWHTTQIAWFTLALALAAVAARRLAERAGAAPWVAVVGAIAGAVLVGCHPAVAEPVAWIASRKDLVLAACASGALVALVPPDPRTEPPSWRFAASLVIACLGLGAKSTAIAFGPALLALWLLLGAGRELVLRGAAVWAVGCAAVVAVSTRQQAELGRRVYDGWDRLDAIVASLSHHIGRVAAANRAPIYATPDHLTSTSLAVATAVAFVIVMAACGGVVWRATRSGRPPAVGAGTLGAWACLGAGVAVSLVAVAGSSLLTALADRYVLPALLPFGVIGLAALVAASGAVRARGAGIAAAAMVIVALVLAPAQRGRLEAWRSPSSFYAAAGTPEDLTDGSTLARAWSCFWLGGVFVASPDHRRVPYYESERDRDRRLMLAFLAWDACTTSADDAPTCADDPSPTACELRRTVRRDRNRALRMWRMLPASRAATDAALNAQ